MYIVSFLFALFLTNCLVSMLQLVVYNIHIAICQHSLPGHFLGFQNIPSSSFHVHVYCIGNIFENSYTKFSVGLLRNLAIKEVNNLFAVTSETDLRETCHTI